MKSALTEILISLGRDKIRALSIVCLVMIALVSGSWIAVGGAIILVAVLIIDATQIYRATRTLRAIAEGDRFVAFPANFVESQPCRDVAAAGERMRRDLIDADAAIADQRRMLAEVRIRRDGAAFFTTRFHESVAQAFSSFARRGDEICATVDDLNKHNSGLLRDAQTVSDAVIGTACEIEAVSKAAAQIATIVATTTDQIAVSEEASLSTLADLRRARDTIDRLKQASQEISTISDIIRSVASQTSLLALNATIEAARAGEKGLGFAVVASEVKTLATRSEQATGIIRRQIEDIQRAVDETSGAIDAIMTRVTALTATNEAFTASLAQSTAAIENVGTKADKVAVHVSNTMPDLASGVGEIELAGRSVLDHARKLMAGSEQLVAGFHTYFEDLASGSIKVGILHSLSGTVTAAERPLHDLLVGLIDDTNRDGGLLGRPIEAMIANPRAEAHAYAEGAQRLIEGGAAALFGCWTSQSRRETVPIIEAAEKLLFYPSQYEGGEVSPWVVCTGGTPQQQAWPAVDFLVASGRRNLVLIGHPTIYSKGTHALIKRYAPNVGATIIADIPVQSDVSWSRIVAGLRQAERHGGLAIISTLSGDASVQYFREMGRQGIGAHRMPTLSLSIGEAELPALEPRIMAGNFVAWNYLHGLAGDANEDFVARWRRISANAQSVTNDALQATYLSFQLWTMAVKKAGSVSSADVRAALQGLSLQAPSGFSIAVTHGQHLHLPAFVGEIQADGRIAPVWVSKATRDPAGHEQHLRDAAA